jgi:diaminohydroxyphosphoribosylaminopyrimidine deaminase / 5-amino-6-(5-phosphoribosylamino)uracil reductase
LDAVVNGAALPVTSSASDDNRFMDRALALAARGIGFVEPNPAVGCVIVRDGRIVGEGFHERFGGSHAEVNALAAAGDAAKGATAYVTLEPCCHHGKTPPCTQALIASGIARVVAAVRDPFPQVGGRGIGELKAAGVACDEGVRAAESNWLLAPYRKLITTGRSWVIAKWAMTLDGKLATRTGDSKWISSEASRAAVHQLRGRMDAIIVGSGTAHVDDPLLTARTVNPEEVKRVATRIVVDSSASLSTTSRLMRTSADIPVLVAVSDDAPVDATTVLKDAGAEVFFCEGTTRADRMDALLRELGGRRMTNILVEGGGKLLGTLFDARAVDEVHVFIAPKLAGGADAITPVAGLGVERMASALRLADIAIEELEGDVHIYGRIAR